MEFALVYTLHVRKTTFSNMEWEWKIEVYVKAQCESTLGVIESGMWWKGVIDLTTNRVAAIATQARAVLLL